MGTIIEEKEYIKLALMGGGGVGKSNITLRFVQGAFKEFYDPTIEDSYIKDNYIVDDETFSLEIFDTAGQDAFTGMRDTYYSNMDGFLFVYSITDKSSLQGVEERIESLRRLRDPDNLGLLPPLMILGNKNDLEDQRVISKAEGESFTQKVGDSVIFMETSAKTNTNIDKIFEDMVRQVIKRQKIQGGEPGKMTKKGGGCPCSIM